MRFTTKSHKLHDCKNLARTILVVDNYADPLPNNTPLELSEHFTLAKSLSTKLVNSLNPKVER